MTLGVHWDTQEPHQGTPVLQDPIREGITTYRFLAAFEGFTATSVFFWIFLDFKIFFLDIFFYFLLL